MGVGWSKLTRRRTDGKWMKKRGRRGRPDAKQAGHGHGWGMTEKKNENKKADFLCLFLVGQ